MKRITRVVVKTTTTTKSDGSKESTTTIETDGDLSLDQIKSVLDFPPVVGSKWWKDLFSLS